MSRSRSPSDRFARRQPRRWRLGRWTLLHKFLILWWATLTLATPIGIYVAFLEEQNAAKGMSFALAFVAELLAGWFLLPKYFGTYAQFEPGRVLLFRMGERFFDSDSATVEIPPFGLDELLSTDYRPIEVRNKGAIRAQGLPTLMGGQALWTFRLKAFIKDAESNGIPIKYVGTEVSASVDACGITDESLQARKVH